MDFGAADVAMPAVLRDFVDLGRHIFEQPVDQAAASALLAAIHANRAFDASLFQDEADFLANPVHIGVNPRPGRNLLDTFADRLGFVEDSPMIVTALSDLLGSDYEILGRKIVCGLPESIIPEWVKARVAGDLVNNLGAYMRPEYRDITYFYGIDFHQDLIDFKDREADFITLYCYLHPVTRRDAPLFLLEGSQRLGATVFPHALSRDGDNAWRYGDRRGGEITVGQRILTGDTGFTAIWHACTLHGTQPDSADHERISLRYLLARRPGSVAGIDAVNRAIGAPMRLTATRVDLTAEGAPTLKGNIVNQV